MFELKQYVENLCWRAFQKNRFDPALDLSDFRQHAALALLKAQKTFDKEKGEWNSYAVACVRNSLLKVKAKYPPPLDKKANYVPPADHFIFEVRDMFDNALLTPRAQKLLRAALKVKFLEPCTMRALGISLGMSKYDLQLAVSELRNKFRTNMV